MLVKAIFAKIRAINTQTCNLLFEELNNIYCRIRTRIDMIERTMKHRRRM